MDDLENKATEYRRWANWAEAKTCYEQMLEDPTLGPLDRAKTLANKMQMQEKLADRDGALASGREVLELVEQYRLYESNDGVRVRGFVEGRMARLTGDARFVAPVQIGCLLYLGGIAGLIYVFVKTSDWTYRSCAILSFMLGVGYLRQALYRR